MKHREFLVLGNSVTSSHPLPLPAADVSPRRKRPWILILLLSVGAIGGWWAFRHSRLGAATATETAVPEVVGPSVDPTGTLLIPEDAVRSMRLSASTARLSAAPSALRLTGRLMYDPNELVHVNTRFPGEVISIAPCPDAHRPLRVGDRVEQGQLLAIVWSKEIGEKKSDLVEALSQLKLHEALYKTLKSLQNSGAVPQRSIDEMERLYESDLIEVERFRRTLRSWKLSEEELHEVEQEAAQFRDRVKLPIGKELPPDPPSKVDATWVEIDIKAPLTGVILEKNLTIGDIVQTDDDLFKIADLSRLVVMANIFEEDIPALAALPEDQRIWQIRLTTNRGSTAVSGKISMIGNVIDPNQHTAVVQGWIDNSQGGLRVGQFVEALVPLPPQPGLIEIPLSGLIDEGPKKFVLVALDESLTTVRRREVSVVRRTQTSAFLRPDGPLAVHAGERILTRGVLELAGILDKFGPAPSGAAAVPAGKNSSDA